ncbi:MAG: HAD hydrolase-like protein, partial [Burkholderiaceae bacterium]
MTARFKARAVLIDLDGTLVDSLPDIACAVNSMRAELGFSMLPSKRIASYVGKGVDVLVHRALTGTMDDQAQPEAFHRGKTAFDRHYRQVNGNESRVYPGVRQALEELQ